MCSSDLSIVRRVPSLRLTVALDADILEARRIVASAEDEVGERLVSGDRDRGVRAAGLVDKALAQSGSEGGGPSLIAVRIDGQPAVATTERDPVKIRQTFMRGIARPA